jgi:hypothetical protein
VDENVFSACQLPLKTFTASHMPNCQCAGMVTASAIGSLGKTLKMLNYREVCERPGKIPQN